MIVGTGILRDRVRLSDRVETEGGEVVTVPMATVWARMHNNVAIMRDTPLANPGRILEADGIEYVIISKSPYPANNRNTVLHLEQVGGQS